MRVFRLARVALHLARGVATAGLVFPFLDKARRVDRIRRWSSGLLRILAIRLEASGTPPGGTTVPVMIVANHVSWLDIYAINTVRTARFIAKSEVWRWPVIGWLCEQAGTFFIERTRRRHTAQINDQVAAALAQGDTVAVFPEGTSTAGNVVLPFHASLLQPALECKTLLYPVAIRYTRADGSLCSEADYAGDKSIAGSLRLMVTQPVIRARLQFLPPLTCAGRPRQELAREAARLIAGALGVEFPDYAGRASIPVSRIDSARGSTGPYSSSSFSSSSKSGAGSGSSYSSGAQTRSPVSGCPQRMLP